MKRRVVQAQVAVGPLLGALCAAILITVVAGSWMAMRAGYHSDARTLAAALTSVMGIARSSDGALVTIQTGSAPSVEVSAGLSTVGNGAVPVVSLQTAPTVSGVSAGVTSTFAVDPDGTTTLNGSACSTVTIVLDSKTFTITCNPWSVTES